MLNVAKFLAFAVNVISGLSQGCQHDVEDVVGAVVVVVVLIDVVEEVIISLINDIDPNFWLIVCNKLK